MRRGIARRVLAVLYLSRVRLCECLRRDEASWPEANVDDDGDEERQGIKTIEEALVTRDCAFEALRELDYTIEGTNLRCKSER